MQQVAPIATEPFEFCIPHNRIATCPIVKRTEDIVFSLLILVLILPALITIAIAIKLDSPGPVFFRQRRRGLYGKPFRIFKFRTMHHDKTDHDCRHQTRRNDPRVTRVGGFLRRTSLDELPQLFNVIMGQMSLVGPRPHAPGTNIGGVVFENLMPHYMHRYSVKPGITGWAQVNGCRGIVDHPNALYTRVQYDFYYIANWSVWFDIRIIFATVACLRGRGAF